MSRRETAYMLGLRRTEPWAGVTDADYARMVSCESPRRARGGRIRYSSLAVGLLGDALAARGKRLEIGLCWVISRPPRARTIVWHNGGTWGFRSFAGFVPERGTAVILMSNTARSVDRAGFAIAKATNSPI